ncbi:MAG: MipA/OmpV family protein [Pseudomonadota bacterium]
MKALPLLAVVLQILLVAAAAADSQTNKDTQGRNPPRQPPQGFLYGLGISFNDEIYKGFSSDTNVIPIIGYMGERWQIFGPFISYHFYKTKKLTLSLKASPRFDDFDEDDSEFFRGMEDRKLSMDGGVGLSLEEGAWTFALSAAHDLLDRSDGYEVDAGINHKLRFGPVFFDTGLHIKYQDSDMVDYYYGVRTNEATPERPFYKGEKAINPSISFGVSTPILLGGMTRLNFEYTWFDNAITDSPLTEDDASLGILMSYSRFFK